MKRSAISPPSRPESAEAGETSLPVWCAAAIALLGARWLIPTEAPEQGRTLWIVVAWFVLAAAWLWRCQRLGTPFTKWDRWDALIAALCGGYVVSALHVLIVGGQRRAALTMLWEWLAMGVAILLCRRLFRDGAARQSLLIALTSLVISLAGLGVWQHHVWYANLGRQFAEYESLTGRSDLTSAERQRLQVLRDELGPEVALLDSSSRESFRNRVLSSTEPVGRFALANSFAALLLFAFLILAGRGFSSPTPDRTWARLLPLLAASAIVGYVLLLTKSRSAWMGLIAAAFAAAGGMLARRGERKLSRGPIITVVTLIALLFAATWWTGGLDRLVLSEAGKSLRYRLEFWQATWGVIQDVPWLGTGPGQFRSHYLQYKLPGSSEEILDPHNLFLEVWAIGGLIPLLALTALLLGATISGIRQWSQPLPPIVADWRSACWGVALAGLLPLAWQGLVSANWDMQLVMITGAGLLVAIIWAAMSRGRMVVGLDRPMVLLSILSALVVHLLTSGGIGMPGITQLVLLICLLTVDRSRSISEETTAAVGPSRIIMVASLTSAAMAVGAVGTGLIPVLNTTTFIQAGDVEAQQNPGSEKAARYYALACDADPLDPTPWNRRAQFLMSRWETASPRSTRERLLSQVVEMQEESLRRDSRNPRLIFELGEWQWRAYQRDHDEITLKSSVRLLWNATAWYPNSSLYNGTMCQAWDAVGEPARASYHAIIALRLDDLNRAAGHTDRYLPDDMLQELLLIANQSLPEAEGN